MFETRLLHLGTLQLLRQGFEVAGLHNCELGVVLVVFHQLLELNPQLLVLKIGLLQLLGKVALLLLLFSNHCFSALQMLHQQVILFSQLMDSMLQQLHVLSIPNCQGLQ